VENDLGIISALIAFDSKYNARTRSKREAGNTYNPERKWIAQKNPGKSPY